MQHQREVIVAEKQQISNNSIKSRNESNGNWFRLHEKLYGAQRLVEYIGFCDDRKIEASKEKGKRKTTTTIRTA